MAILPQRFIAKIDDSPHRPLHARGSGGANGRSIEANPGVDNRFSAD
jgi:hypothetical protein